MALTPGTRLGVYEITAQIGAGGMGEVYRATDSNLKRQVAIKVLPASVAGDADRLARFQREAEVLAALNHPNIAAIYGLEKTPTFTALVMELVEGEDLSEKIGSGLKAHGSGLPIDEALNIAKQIAEALEAAHEQGIIHRDLKPANIKIRADGTVKVLDFGLAKALGPAEAGHPVPSTLSMSPTITTPAMTQAGMILGTAAYMSPEQAKGRAVDRRTDVWAFGAVLYEMLTGKRAFGGDDVQETFVAILRDEPDYSALPPDTPRNIQRLLKRTLAKDPRERLRDIADARLELREDSRSETLSTGAAAAPETHAPASAARTRLLPVAAAAAIGAAVVSGAIAWTVARSAARPAPAQGATRFAYTLPNDQPWTGISLLDLSADGRNIVYAANDQLYIRSLNRLDARPIDGTAGQLANAPVFSPDGQWIAYGSREGNSYQLKKVPVGGGTPTKLCDLTSSTSGIRWVGDRIVLTQQELPTGVGEVPASGGTLRMIVTAAPDEVMSNPDVLDDGATVLVTLRAPGMRGSIVAQSLKSGQRHVVLKEGSFGRAIASGQIFFTRGATLYVQPFNTATLDISGGPTPVATDLLVNASFPNAAAFAVSRTGTLAYVPSSHQVRRVEWVGRRDGREQPIGAEPMVYIYPTVSPDGSRIAFNVHDNAYSIWTWTVATSALNRLTLEAQDVRYALWTTDSKRVIYSLTVRGGRQLMWTPADGSGSAEAISPNVDNQYPVAAAPDGKTLIFRRGPAGDFTFRLQSLEADRSIRPLIDKPAASLYNGEISPDGRWLAYQAGNPGASDIYVQPFPNVGGGRWLVSTHGGSRPLWSRSGRELFYLTQDNSHIAAVPITPGSSFVFGRPDEVLDIRRFVVNFQGGSGDVGRTYDVSPDGERFLLMAPANDAAQRIVVMEHLVDELTAAPAGK